MPAKIARILNEMKDELRDREPVDTAKIARCFPKLYLGVYGFLSHPKWEEDPVYTARLAQACFSPIT